MEKSEYAESRWALMSDKAKSIIWPLAFGLIFLLIWELGGLHAVLNLKPFQLPTPFQIAQTIAKNGEKALLDCSITISGAMIGMFIGSFIGFLVAVMATIFPKWGYGGLTLVSAFNAIPIVALSPIMNRWFSTSMGQKIGVVSVVCMAAMAINAYHGLNNLKPFSLDLMKSIAASKVTIFFKLRLPNCISSILTALKINIAASIIAAIISEYFAASTSGLGFGIKDNLRKAEMAMGWSYIILAAAAGIIMYCIILVVERHAVKGHASQR